MLRRCSIKVQLTQVTHSRHSSCNSAAQVPFQHPVYSEPPLLSFLVKSCICSFPHNYAGGTGPAVSALTLQVRLQQSLYVSLTWGFKCPFFFQRLCVGRPSPVTNRLTSHWLHCPRVQAARDSTRNISVTVVITVLYLNMWYLRLDHGLGFILHINLLHATFLLQWI